MGLIQTTSYATIMRKRTIITIILAGILCMAQAQNNNATCVEYIHSSTAINRVLGDGRKMETVVIKYDAPISNKSLTARSFRVQSGSFTRLTGGNHRATCFVAYDIEGVQDWLFEQYR